MIIGATLYKAQLLKAKIAVLFTPAPQGELSNLAQA